MNVNINSIRPKSIVDLNRLVDAIPCSNENLYHTLDIYTKILVIGDIHGDLEALLSILWSGGAIDIMGNWIGDNMIVVQTGDILDDCRPKMDDSVKSNGECINEFVVGGFDEIIILAYLADLHQQAKKYNGKVLLCMGNHEWDNTLGDDMDYVQPKTRAGWGIKRNNLLKPGGKLAKKLACNLKICHIIGNWIFLHGGLRCSVISNRNDIEKSDENMRKYLEGSMNKQEEMTFRKSINKDWFFHDRSTSSASDLSDSHPACNEFEKIKLILNIPNLRMAVGHSTQIIPNSVCNGQIFRIDTRMSQAYGIKSNPNERIFGLIISNGGKDVHTIIGGIHNKLYPVLNNKQYKQFLKLNGYSAKKGQHYNGSHCNSRSTISRI